MSVLYADTSALVRAYLADEPDHDLLRRRLLEGDEPVVTSELTRVELAADEPLIVVTRDDQQARAAGLLGLETA